MTHAPAPSPAPAAPAAALKREVMKLGAAFAAGLFLVSSLVWGLAGIDPVASAGPKLLGIAGDAGLAGLITLVLWRLGAWALPVKLGLGAGLALGLAPVSGLIDWGLHIWAVAPEPVPFQRDYFASVVIFTTSELFGWACIVVALQYSAQTRAAERRLAQLREEAQAAQLRALHYQINPHFLFNTLNSVAGLIEEDEATAARDMVLGLAGFLRGTLTLDPLSEVALADELALQRAYLAIEAARFSDRMRVEISLPEALGRARVPALILQPLIENAVKHGVARSPGPVTIRLAARAEAGGLRIAVETIGAPARAGAAPAPGIGLGLANVDARLAGLYPGRAGARGAMVAPGQHRAEIWMPLA